MPQPAAKSNLSLYMVLGTGALHGAMMVANELFFRKAEFLQGIGWIYLPAGTRLLCTLLFGQAGAIGWLLSPYCLNWCEDGKVGA